MRCPLPVEKTSNTPIIILTAQGSESIAVEFLKKGACDYVSKSDVTPARIGHAVRNAVRVARLSLLLVVILSGVTSALVVSAVFRLGRPAAAILSASFAQAGEFSFILAALGVTLGLLGQSSHDVILAAALLSIAVNPVLFTLADRLQPTRPPKS